MSEWRKIEDEMPTTGVPVDLWRDGERLTDFALDERGYWTRKEGYPAKTRVLMSAPSHWRPIPPPPETEK